MRDKIGIIGVGFVGSAIRDSFVNAPVDLVLLDTNPAVATGTFGFGGMCFPKDTAALKKVSNDLNVNMSLLSAAIESNNRIRSK